MVTWLTAEFTLCVLAAFCFGVKVPPLFGLRAKVEFRRVRGYCWFWFTAMKPWFWGCPNVCWIGCWGGWKVAGDTFLLPPNCADMNDWSLEFMVKSDFSFFSFACYSLKSCDLVFLICGWFEFVAAAFVGGFLDCSLFWRFAGNLTAALFFSSTPPNC